jgi:hypothetical protein
MSNDFDPIKIAARAMELLGGREKAKAAMEAEYYELKKRWDKDVNLIGRILRAHLHVEYYLTEYLETKNPNLNSLEDNRLTFNQKLKLLRPDDHQVAYLLGGIAHLNKIRNRLAHNLEATVTEDDKKVFLQGFYKAFREAGYTSIIKSEEPIDILEEFAEFASTMLHGPATPTSQAFKQAIDENVREK